MISAEDCGLDTHAPTVTTAASADQDITFDSGTVCPVLRLQPHSVLAGITRPGPSSVPTFHLAKHLSVTVMAICVMHAADRVQGCEDEV